MWAIAHVPEVRLVEMLKGMETEGTFLLLRIKLMEIISYIYYINGVPALLRYQAFETTQRSAQCSQPGHAMTS